MLKKISMLMAVIFVVFSLTAFAAPYSTYGGSYGGGLVTVTNPASSTISSYDAVHNISGYAVAGATLTLYRFDGNGYNMMYANGAPVSWTVGSSGMFVKPVALYRGQNHLILRADYGESSQQYRFTITVLSSNLLDLINSFNFEKAD
ncbi:hypothetical protein [Acetivibrio sp. MSJd-27]|uniref:hypothetical protein n=1 Tax=Acetivibrio sp. MSJd-27 TaxID=2841523 RepID=UPI0015B0370E|nr:hypothetical protein [Acetivibrio sp. MSJd-27]MBU5450950.1 hypothetical protein [Acetivibrio sp. MSJd-27]